MEDDQTEQALVCARGTKLLDLYGNLKTLCKICTVSLSSCKSITVSNTAQPFRCYLWQECEHCQSMCDQNITSLTSRFSNFGVSEPQRTQDMLAMLFLAEIQRNYIFISWKWCRRFCRFTVVDRFLELSTGRTMNARLTERGRAYIPTP